MTYGNEQLYPSELKIIIYYCLDIDTQIFTNTQPPTLQYIIRINLINKNSIDVIVFIHDSL